MGERSVTGTRGGATPLVKGNGSARLTYDVGAIPLNLTPGQRALLALPLTGLFEVTTATIRRGTWGGPTFRVTKGFWYRLGSSQSVTERSQNISNVDQGTLVVTNASAITDAFVEAGQFSPRSEGGRPKHTSGASGDLRAARLLGSAAAKEFFGEI